MWHYTKAPVNVRAGWTVYCGDDPIADVLPDCDDSRARLIAAAPALLDALRRVMRHIPENAGGASLSDDMHRARKAIARATSED